MPRRSGKNPWDGVAGALAERYGTQDPDLIGELFSQEIGLGAYKIPRITHERNQGQDIQNKGVSMGAFAPTSRRIKLAKRLSPEDRAGTLVHELGHAADFAETGYLPPEDDPEGFGHHKYFASFEEELPRMLTMQKEIELGLPVTSTRSRRYPWLGDLNPLSSNPMASPWGKKKSFPADIWNALQENRNGR